MVLLLLLLLPPPPPPPLLIALVRACGERGVPTAVDLDRGGEPADVVVRALAVGHDECRLRQVVLGGYLDEGLVGQPPDGRCAALT